MLRFDAYNDGAPAEKLNLSGAYLFGQESIPIRAEIAAAGGQITCAKRAAGAAGLALLWPVKGGGEIMQFTTRLPERRDSYNLNLEIARARMMLLTKKREDWGLIDYPGGEEMAQQFDAARKLFIEALKAQGDDPAAAARLADDCLAAVIRCGERHAMFHAGIFLARRKKTNSFSRSTFGCVVDLFSLSDAYRGRLGEICDFVTVPLPWKHIEPKEKQTHYQQLDAWTDWCMQSRLPIHAGPLVSFEPQFNPDWLYLWEHDYEALREMIYEYVQRVVTRYAKRVGVWNVVSGVHAYNSFNLNFEQIMELTRMSCSLVKKLAPRAQVVVDLVLPWCEYYARNQRTIPPLMYADMCVQSGVKFDAFGVQIYTGVGADGLFVRDPLQISDMLDAFAGFGKSLHLTACQAPSGTAPDKWDAWSGQANVPQGGAWRRPWDEQLQADWLDAVYQMALSKPYVESVCWRDLADYEGHYLPHGGLCHSDLTPKPAFERLKRLRGELLGSPADPPARPASRKNPARPA